MDRLADNTWELWLLTTCGLLVALWLVTEATVWLLMARENRRVRMMRQRRNSSKGGRRRPRGPGVKRPVQNPAGTKLWHKTQRGGL